MSMSCHEEKLCKHPFDNITVIENENEFLRGGQGYAIELSLDMPESEHNLNQGMFMIKLDMTEYNGRVIKSAHRPALLRYRSSIFKVIYTLFFMPGLLAGSFEEKQSLVIPLFEKFIEDSQHPTHYAYIEVQAQKPEIYSSTLRIHAQFTGLRYLMYYWPVTATVIGVGSNFLFLVITMGLIWLRETMKLTKDNQQSFTHVQNLRMGNQTFQKSAFMKDQTSEREKDTLSRIKREKVAIETLPTHSGLQRSKQSIQSRLRDEDGDDDEYFDTEQLALQKNENITPNPNRLELSTLEQRIKQVLGKKE